MIFPCNWGGTTLWLWPAGNEVIQYTTVTATTRALQWRNSRTEELALTSIVRQYLYRPSDPVSAVSSSGARLIGFQADRDCNKLAASRRQAPPHRHKTRQLSYEGCGSSDLKSEVPESRSPTPTLHYGKLYYYIEGHGNHTIIISTNSIRYNWTK